MAKDIRVRLYSNSTEFRNEMRAIAKQMQLVKSEFEANRTSAENWGNELKQSEAKISFLNKQIELQKQKLEALNRAYADAVEKKGADSKEAQNLARRLNYATAELNKMQNELEQTTQKLNEFRENQSIKQFESDLKALSLAMKKVDAEFKVASTAADNFGNELKQTDIQIQTLNQKIELQQQVISRLEEEYRRVAQAKGKDAVETKQLAIRLDEARAELNGFQNELTQTTEKLSRLQNELQQQNSAFSRFASNMDAIGNKMTTIGTSVGVTAGAGFAAISLSMKNAVQTGMEFGQQISRVAAISEASAEELKQLKEQAQQLGATTSKSATEIARGQEQLAASGFKVNEILGAMPGVIAAAEASGEDMAAVSEIMAAAIRGFGLEASSATHIADVFAMAANRSNASIVDMGYSFKYAAPIAKQLGMSVEELAAVTGLLRDRGMAAEQVGTSMRMGLTRLIAPTEEGALVMEKLGINIKDAEGKMRPFADVIEELREKTKDLSQEQKLNAYQTIFGTESMTAFLNLVEAGPDALRDLTSALEASTGASKKAADIMKDNLAGSVEEMNGAIETAKINLTEALAPALRTAAETVTGLVDKWNSLDKGTQEVIAKSAALATAMLGVVAVVGTLTAAIGALVTFAGPVGLAIVGVTTALGALGVGLFAAREATENLRKKQEEAERQAIRYGEGLSAGTKKAVQGYTDLYEGAKLKMIELQTMSGEKARATSKEVVDAFSKMADQVIAALQTQRDKLIGAINDVYGIAGDAGKKKAKEMTDDIIKSFDKDIAQYKKALDTIKEAHEKYNNDLSRMPAEFAAKYQEALKVMEGGAREFAQSQNELQAIQKSIIDKQGKILFEEAEGYVKRINETYQKSVSAANKWYSEKQKVFEQALAQGRISQQQYDQLMLGVEARTNEMLAKAAQERDKSLSTLASHLDQRGKLIDIATGKIFERQKRFLTDMNGFIVQVEESDKEYIERWKAHTEEVLKKTADFSEKTKSQYQRDLAAFLQATGMTRQQAVKMAEQMVNETLAEMKKGNKEAENAGKAKGTSHKAGLESTKSANKNAGASVSQTTNAGLAQGKEDSHKHGKEKGQRHDQGIRSTIPQNKNASKLLSSAVAYILGQTTDGGGGRRAGTMFTSGLSSQQGRAYSSGKSVSSRAESGLRSHNSSGAGWDFVQGFINAISAGSGSISLWRAAWNLGKRALAALKESIDSHSPSKETEKEGKNFVDGFSVGVQKYTKTASASVIAMANTVKKAFNNAMAKAKYNYNMGIYSHAEYIRELQRIRAQYAKTPELVRKVNLEIKRIQDLMAKRTAAQIESERKARESLNKSVMAASEAYYKKIKSINDKLDKDIKKLNENYKKQLAERTRAIYQSIGLFDDVKIDQVSKEDLSTRLKSQVDRMKQFYSDIDALSKKAPKDFVNELREMGIGYADEIHALTTMTDSELNEYVNLWKQKHRIAAKQAEIELEPLKKSTEAQIKSLTAAANKELDKAKKDFINKLKSLSSTVAKLGSLRNSGKVLGKNTVQGLIEGLKSMEGPLKKQAAQIAKTIENEIKRVLKIRSPSGVMRDEIAPWIPAGIAEGMKQNIGFIQKAVEHIVRTTKEKFHEDMGKASFYISSAAQEIKDKKHDLLIKSQVDSPSLQREIANLQNELRHLAELFREMLQVQSTQLAIATQQPIVLNIDSREIAKAIYKPINELIQRDETRNARFEGR
jgi:TP901 family phage tail tape measure protein